MSNMEEESTFCSENNESQVDYDSFDYMLLFRALDNIRVSTKEYLESSSSATSTDNDCTNTSCQEVYKRIKDQYSQYKCGTKEDITNNRSRKKFVNSFFKIIIYLLIFSYSLWLCREVFNAMRGKKHSVSIMYALAFLVSLNPFYSFITITVDMLQYRASQTMNHSKKQVIEEVQRNIENAISCPDSFTKTNICNYYKYFESEENEKICSSYLAENEIDTGNTELSKDALSSKMEKLDSVHQFFENQKKFTLKIHNPFVQIKQHDKLDNVIRFLLGDEVETKINENMNNDDNVKLYNTTTEVRENVHEILRFKEGHEYHENGSVQNYNKYFVEELNNLLFDLTKQITTFLSVDTNYVNYFRNNKHIKRFDTKSMNNIFGCQGYNFNNEYLNCDSDLDLSINNNIPNANDIMHTMFDVQKRLRRLNVLWLPEYENLRKLLYNDLIYNNTRYNADLKLQKSLYQAKKFEYLAPLFAQIVAIIIDNEHFVEAKRVYTQQKTIDDVILEQCYIDDCDNDVSFKNKLHIRPIFNETAENNFIDLNDYFDTTTTETLLMSKCKNFIYSLKNKTLNTSFSVTNKVESVLIKNVILSEIEDINLKLNKISVYINKYIDENNIFAGSDSSKKLIFMGNCNQLIKYSLGNKTQQDKNAELYFNAQNEIEYPDKYISFDEFNTKLMNLEKGQFNKYIDYISQTKKDTVYFIDKLDELNNKMERKHFMSNYYKQYVIIYTIASFFILCDIVWKSYFDEEIDISYMNKINK